MNDIIKALPAALKSDAFSKIVTPKGKIVLDEDTRAFSVLSKSKGKEARTIILVDTDGDHMRYTPAQLAKLLNRRDLAAVNKLEVSAASEVRELFGN